MQSLNFCAMECRMDQYDSVLSQENQDQFIINNTSNAAPDAVDDAGAVTLVRELFRSDFEIEGVKDYYRDGFYLKQINGWTGNQLVEVNSRYGGADGSDFLIELNRDPTAKFQDAPSISRTLATADGALYNLSFDFASRPGLMENSSHIGLFLDGQQVADWQANGQGSNQPLWQNGAYNFTGTGQAVTVEFREMGDDIDHGRGMLLDNISLTETLESLVTDETSTVLIDVLANDSDPQGQPLTIISLSDVFHDGQWVGQTEVVTVGGRQQVQFTPNEQLQALTAGEEAELSFGYTIADPDGNTDSATASFTVQGVNDTPDAAQDSYVMRYAGRLIVDVRENDTDAEDDALSVTHINGTELVVGQAVRVEIYQGVKPVRADITLQVDGQLQIDHIGGNSLRDLYFEYTLSDGTSSTDSIATVQILPKIKADITAISEDTDTPGDFRTADLNGLTISGNVTGALLPEETLQITWPRSGGWQTVSVDNDTLSWSFDDNTGRSNGDEVVYTTRIQDAFGRNLDVDKQTVVFESDVSPAEINITHISEDTGFFDDDFNTADRTLEVYGTLSEALGPDDRVEVTWDGGQTWYTATVNGTDWSYDSSHFEHDQRARPLYEVRIINDKGHIGDVDDQRIIVDALPGRYNTISIDGISTDTGTDNDFITQDNTLTINGSLMRNLGNDQMVWIYSDADPDWQVQATVNNDYTWSVIDPLVHGLNSDVTYTAKIIDLAGNVMGQDSQLVVIDNTAPSVDVAITAITEDTALADFRTADLDGITVSGTVGPLADDEAVQIKLKGISDWLGTVVNNSDGSWTYDDLTARNDGDIITYKVRVIDGAGNVGDTDSQVVTFVDSDVLEVVGDTSGYTKEDTVLYDSGDLDIKGMESGGFVGQKLYGYYGNVTMSTDGEWTYTLNNNATIVQQLRGGQRVEDSFVYKTVDGAEHNLTIDVEGKDDAARVRDVNLGSYRANTTHGTTKGSVSWSDIDFGEKVTFSSGTQKLKYWGPNHTLTVDSSGNYSFKPGYVYHDEFTDVNFTKSFSWQSSAGSFKLTFSFRTGPSPIILDLDGDGVETLATADGVEFDIYASGSAVATGWVGADDALLVRDLNGDGIIDDARELFGDHTLMQDGSQAEDGFHALAELDSNADGKIDAQDQAFSELQLWQDRNSDGLVQQGELLTLQEAGVASVNTSASISEMWDESGNFHGLQSTYITSEGEERAATDVWFTTGLAEEYYGSDISDEIVTGIGDDILIGAGGDDILTGGEGRDTFIWQAGDQGSEGHVATDTITDFNLQEDLLNLSDMLDFDAAGDVLGDYLSLSRDAQGDAVIEVASSGGEVDQRIVLENVSADMAMESNLISSLQDEGQLII
ncbi:VCBS domain-containing protein [Amphritea sp. HPY]|uniref:VCBS domain-containing protein n=1 Tax=Amphritea sp. HPY TaxID=3421652 RepID=UPI003D7D8558